MLDMIDLRGPAFRTPPRLAAPLLDTDPAALACDASGPGVIPPPGSVTPPRRPGLTHARQPGHSRPGHSRPGHSRPGHSRPGHPGLATGRPLPA